MGRVLSYLEDMDLDLMIEMHKHDALSELAEAVLKNRLIEKYERGK